MKELLKEKGIKRTDQRELMLEVLRDSKRPLTAEDIFKKTEGVSLATVYRTLDLFAEKGLIEQHTFKDSEKKFYELSGNAHRHYAVCLGCRQMEYVNVCPVHDLHIEDFEITGHRLEIYGYCKDCRSKVN